MTQKTLIINGLEFIYKGVFKFDEFYNVLGKSVEERGYTRHEKRFEEYNKESGKEMFMEFRPTKVKTVYQALMIKIRVEMKNVRDIILDVDGVQDTFQEGEIYLMFDSWVTTRLNQKWNMNPIFYFIRAVIHKYIYNYPIEGEAPGEVASDTHYVMQKLKAHLNLYKYKIAQEVEA